VAAALAAVVAGAVLAGCSAGGTAPASPASPASPADVFTASHQVSLQQVRTEIGALYIGHPGIASFAVQDVQYTASSRDVVLRQCTAGGPAGGARNTETGQVIACAPLIFFFYSYGLQASVPAAVTVAGDLYWYAVSHITGPFSARTSLDELLRSWKLPVRGLTAAEARNAVNASVVTAATDSMLASGSVRVVITDHTAGAAYPERIAADIGPVTGTELITYGPATATIRVTRQAAYFTGNTAGLTAYIGLPPAAAARVRSRWVAIETGTSEYQALAAEDTLAALPSSILPSAADTTRLRSATIGGQKAYIMDWTTRAAASGTAGAVISVRLTLSAAPRVLPVSESITTGGERKTVTFSGWGAPLMVTAPAPVIPYSKVIGA
jgi:hypothetical protein